MCTTSTAVLETLLAIFIIKQTQVPGVGPGTYGAVSKIMASRMYKYDEQNIKVGLTQWTHESGSVGGASCSFLIIKYIHQHHHYRL